MIETMEFFTDIHCHILPGVDDGPTQMEESLQLLRMEKEQGVRRVIFTPHYCPGIFGAPRSKVRSEFLELREQAVKQGLDMELLLGCELHRHDDILETLKKDSAFCMADTPYVLLEFAIHDSYNTIQNYTTGMVNYGYQPILAHAERYLSLRNPAAIQNLIAAGACIQVNADSVLGITGWKDKQYCMKLLKKDLVHFIGSDAHDGKLRIPRLGTCARYLEKKLGQDKAHELLKDNPEKLVCGEHINKERRNR